MASRKRPRHNYSEDTKKLCLAQTEPTPYAFCKNADTPDASTVYRWKRQEAAPPRDPAVHSPHGRPPKLSRQKQLVVGGWVLFYVKAHKQTSINAIQKFITASFQEDVSIAWVSIHMKALHRSSHQAANKPSKYARPQLLQELYQFLKVAVDTVRFTHPEYILRTYASQGSGQPSLWENRFDYKTILYKGLIMSREVLPPVIFTNCPTMPMDVDIGEDGKVVYIPGLSAPSADLILWWLDLVGDYLNDNPLVVHDHGPEYTAHLVQDFFIEMGASTCSFPATGGAFVNPCDNPFNSQLKKLYFQEHHDS
ncbi:hypothetical protein QOT17_024258 [Balamuthia mandrillaris]